MYVSVDVCEYVWEVRMWYVYLYVCVSMSVCVCVSMSVCMIFIDEYIDGDGDEDFS